MPQPNEVISSLHNAFVKHVTMLRMDRDYRYEHQSIIVEGLKPIQEVVHLIKHLYYTEKASSLPWSVPQKTMVTEAVMKKMSGMATTEGVLAQVKMPPFSSLKGKKFVVAFDGVSEPGNLGTLLRTALALGWEGIYLLPNCCDLYNDKVIRAARGAHFRLPIAKGTVEELKKLADENKLSPLVADLKGQSPEKLSINPGRLLILGNEAHGASAEIKQFCTPVTIPMPGEMESLNVAIAGGILMYLLKTPKQSI